MYDGNNCFVQQAFIKVLLHLIGDTADRMKLLIPIWFSNEETKVIIIIVFFYLVCSKANCTLWKIFMDAVVVGFNLNSHDGSCLINVSLSLKGPIFLY